MTSVRPVVVSATAFDDAIIRPKNIGAMDPRWLIHFSTLQQHLQQPKLLFPLRVFQLDIDIDGLLKSFGNSVIRNSST